MKRKSKGMLGVGFLLVTIISGAVTSFIFLNKQDEKEEAAENVINYQIETEKKEKVMNIVEILDGIEEVYIESYVGANDIVEINNEKVLEELIEELQSLNLKFVMKSVEDHKNKIDYCYAIHIKNKNIKIKVNGEYILMEDVQGETQVFEVDPKQLENIKERIESIYMNGYSAKELFKGYKKAYIIAEDENAKWLMNEKDIEKMIESTHLIAPIKAEEMIATPHEYPNYEIDIETDGMSYKIHFVNEEVIALDTPDSRVFYRYDSKLWDYMKNRYPVEFNEKQRLFKELLKSTKVIVDDMEDLFDFEDDQYYHKEIPRWLMKLEKEKIKEVPSSDPLIYDMKFFMGEENVEVKIYENYIEYKGKAYYSQKVGESIRSVLGM